jgi:putative tricarboxylic transport membrane protein
MSRPNEPEDLMPGLLRALVALALSLAAASANAQTYPGKPITIVVPFAAGSGTDSITRIVGQQLSVALNQSVVIENKVGASGVIAATYVARAAPDGYTLLMATNSTHSANPSLFKSLSYDPVKDFAPVARAGSYVFMLVVNKDIPAKTLPELVAYAKANPGKLTYASGNTTGIVAGETLKSKAGIDVLHVPYKSTPPALNDVIGGRISMMFIDLAPGLEHVRAGTLRALAVTTKERSALLPDLPSLHEAGIAGYDVTSWAGLFAPAGTPKEIVARLNAEVARIIANPEAKARIAVTGFDAFTGPPETLASFVQTELTNWSKLIKDAGIEPQ